MNEFPVECIEDARASARLHTCQHSYKYNFFPIFVFALLSFHKKKILFTFVFLFTSYEVISYSRSSSTRKYAAAANVRMHIEHWIKCVRLCSKKWKYTKWNMTTNIYRSIDNKNNSTILH